MTHSIVLQGKFVDLRPLTVQDAEITFSWRQSRNARLLNQGAANVEEQRRWIASRSSSEYNFIIELKGSHPVGMLALTDVDLINRHAEPGRFLIGDDKAVKGIPAAIEAMKLLYQFAFDQLGLVRIFGTIAGDNHLMIKWQKYLGMQEEGRLRRHYFINGHFQDAILLGLLVEEYRDISLPKMNALIAAAQPCPDKI